MTSVYLPQAQFPTEGPESQAEVWDPTTGFLADIPRIKLAVEIITPGSGKLGGVSGDGGHGSESNCIISFSPST